MAQTAAILIVEDDPDISDLLVLHLADLGYRVDTEKDGREGLERARIGDYTLIILDRMLPGLEGLEICRMLREEGIPTPILMLTAKSEEMDKVMGLDTGADDYVTKPFSIYELLARVKALIRRRRLDGTDSEGDARRDIHIGPLEMSPTKRSVVLDGEAVDLTAKEFDLLALFARHPGRAFSRQELLDLVWGYQYAGYSHTVNSHINRLRGKIEPDPEHPTFIRTVWGVGYRFAEAHELTTHEQNV
ncbi:MAG: response regulator transcription factor [Rubricoccaceae bacterium]|nr:response regulator transcription factor [Rubricoccaceae bacterium]